MTTASGSPEGTDQPEQQTAPTDDLVGGEVRIGRGAGPRWLRYWYYLVYLWAILYLLIEDVDRYWIMATFGGLLIVWLGYIIWKKRPPEP
ncbi:MAG: hypothetical protein HYX51_08510 [Chloroflexi bacterium]|nr:hypothetical protein [Chloroflexota bacterium]